MLKRIEDQLGATKDVKATVADYIKLLQYQKELEEDEPKEIRVTWIEPKEALGSDSGE